MDTAHWIGPFLVMNEVNVGKMNINSTLSMIFPEFWNAWESIGNLFIYQTHIKREQNWSYDSMFWLSLLLDVKKPL
jgi:hypothetical protein